MSPAGIRFIFADDFFDSAWFIHVTFLCYIHICYFEFGEK